MTATNIQFSLGRKNGGAAAIRAVIATLLVALSALSGKSPKPPCGSPRLPTSAGERAAPIATARVGAYQDLGCPRWLHGIIFFFPRPRHVVSDSHARKRAPVAAARPSN